jgi:hypothetical protein
MTYHTMPRSSPPSCYGKCGKVGKRRPRRRYLGSWKLRLQDAAVKRKRKQATMPTYRTIKEGLVFQVVSVTVIHIQVGGALSHRITSSSSIEQNKYYKNIPFLNPNKSEHKPHCILILRTDLPIQSKTSCEPACCGCPSNMSI